MAVHYRPVIVLGRRATSVSSRRYDVRNAPAAASSPVAVMLSRRRRGDGNGRALARISHNACGHSPVGRRRNATKVSVLPGLDVSANHTRAGNTTHLVLAPMNRY